ncbi:hypothetical protein L9F63_007398 [Diploptera punctata]|uniref:Dual specificity protein phosphatase 19 n=1 Tax=Diploptera punctata TaxID=6984 RepID=A0AAD7Z8N9_DIPPU|nr:hypothetical protein L9F63_007398 [Diploptera punctata]
MSFLANLQSHKSKLKHCKTIVTTPNGQKYEEMVLPDGNTVSSKIIDSNSPGFVVDMKPDLKIAEIEPGLLLGSQDVVYDCDLMHSHHITHVLSLGIKPIVLDVNIVYKCVDLLDVPESNLLDCLDECFYFIDNALNSGGRVYVHCNAGVSRSPSVVIAYLMKTKTVSYEQAFLQVKQKRHVINPNPGFIQQLKTMKI